MVLSCYTTEPYKRTTAQAIVNLKGYAQRAPIYIYKIVCRLVRNLLPICVRCACVGSAVAVSVLVSNSQRFLDQLRVLFEHARTYTRARAYAFARVCVYKCVRAVHFANCFAWSSYIFVCFRPLCSDFPPFPLLIPLPHK